MKRSRVTYGINPPHVIIHTPGRSETYITYDKDEILDLILELTKALHVVWPKHDIRS